MPEQHTKQERLRNILEDAGKVAVAFSGGVDSTLLAVFASEVLGRDNVRTYTIRTPYMASWELEEAVALSEDYGFHHHLVDQDFAQELRMNPQNRCYLCKKRLFGALIADLDSEWILCDGTNLDDAQDDRPGMAAAKELGIRHPLREAGLNKHDIRQISRSMGLPTAEKGSFACLLTRMPHDRNVRDEDLTMVDQAERGMLDLGFSQPRVRHDGDQGRVQLPESEWPRALQLRRAIRAVVKKAGFGRAVLDLTAYGERS